MFTLTPPLRIEADDIPAEFAQDIDGATCLYEIVVEGSSAPGISRATAFARRLAGASAGIALDEQAGALPWPNSQPVQARVARGAIPTVELHWYTTKDCSGADLEARSWLDAARQFFPQARPRRFGTFEPLQERLDGEDDHFVEFVGHARDHVFADASRPAVSASMQAEPPRDRPVRAHRLTLLAEPLMDPAWHLSLEKFFCEFACRTKVVLATAEIRRGVRWSGRSLGYDGTTENIAYLARAGRWAGLPPYPVWWTWFGEEYEPLVRAYLPAGQLKSYDSGLFHAGSDAPADRDQLAAALQTRDRAASGRRPFFRARPQAKSWLPERLMATVEGSATRFDPGDLRRARVIPEDLR